MNGTVKIPIRREENIITYSVVRKFVYKVKEYKSPIIKILNANVIISKVVELILISRYSCLIIP